MYTTRTQLAAKVTGAISTAVGIVLLILATFVGPGLFDKLWGVEPLAYIGAVMVIGGLGMIALTYFIATELIGKKGGTRRWSQVTSRYFELFHHDLGRPLRAILGKEREIRPLFDSYSVAADPAVRDLLDAKIRELLDDIEMQAPSYRLLLSNVQGLIEMESSDRGVQLGPVEPTELVRKITDRYGPTTAFPHKEISWWADPPEFGIIYADSTALEHILTNLVDNAVRYAAERVEIKVST